MTAASERVYRHHTPEAPKVLEAQASLSGWTPVHRGRVGLQLLKLRMFSHAIDNSDNI